MFDKNKYPANWFTEIRPHILERAGYKCEQCGVQNKAVGARDINDVWHDEHAIHYMKSDEGIVLFNGAFPKIIRIALTVAHITNPNPVTCRDENLKALCQGCHNRLDNPMRVEHAKQTRARKKRKTVAASGQLEMELSAGE